MQSEMQNETLVIGAGVFVAGLLKRCKICHNERMDGFETQARDLFSDLLHRGICSGADEEAVVERVVALLHVTHTAGQAEGMEAAAGYIATLYRGVAAGGVIAGDLRGKAERMREAISSVPTES
jgi:hypothetical protein